MAFHSSHDPDGRLLISDGRLTLSERLPRDAAPLAEGKPGGLVWIDGTPGEGTVVASRTVCAAASAGVYRAGWGVFVIRRAEDQVALGGIGFHGPPADGTTEIGYDLSPSARGAGWATDAARLICAWALGQPDVTKVVATTEAANLPSQRVLERAGFTRVADREGLWAYELTGLAA